MTDQPLALGARPRVASDCSWPPTRRERPAGWDRARFGDVATGGVLALRPRGFVQPHGESFFIRQAQFRQDLMDRWQGTRQLKAFL